MIIYLPTTPPTIRSYQIVIYRTNENMQKLQNQI